VPALLYRPPLLDFDASCGFPGEGPASPGLAAMEALSPEMPVEKATQSARDSLWNAFMAWCRAEAIPEETFVSEGPVDVDVINAVMSRYGRALYEAGRPYNHYSETVNALASKLPKIRRLLQPAWDVAFQWQRLEPHIHHQAMPWQVLPALITASLFWGWLDVAGMMALAWGGLGRIGELFAATRGDLGLPLDVQGTIDYILLAIKEPKTRNTAARHQTLKLDHPELMRVVSLAFARKHRAQFLWPFAPGTFRQRFAKLTEAHELGRFKEVGLRPLDLGSL
ncbi:unnamed protein product, partial [Symbiodinium necroappetens]